MATFVTVPSGGSPPPMRGKVTGSQFCGQRMWDHPRLCGEKFSVHGEPHYAPGSPPPMRGKVMQVLDKDNNIRITPAYAGKSPLQNRWIVLR